MTTDEIARIAGNVFSERIGKEWEQANRIHDAQIIATRSVEAHLEGVAITVNGISAKVDWLYTEAQNGGIPSHVGMSVKIKVAAIGLVGTVLSGTAAAIIAAVKS